MLLDVLQLLINIKKKRGGGGGRGDSTSILLFHHITLFSHHPSTHPQKSVGGGDESWWPSQEKSRQLSVRQHAHCGRWTGLLFMAVWPRTQHTHTTATKQRLFFMGYCDSRLSFSVNVECGPNSARCWSRRHLLRLREGQQDHPY